MVPLREQRRDQHLTLAFSILGTIFNIIVLALSILSGVKLDQSPYGGLNTDFKIIFIAWVWSFRVHTIRRWELDSQNIFYSVSFPTIATIFAITCVCLHIFGKATSPRVITYSLIMLGVWIGGLAIWSKCEKTNSPHEWCPNPFLHRSVYNDGGSGYRLYLTAGIFFSSVYLVVHPGTIVAYIAP